jgi:DNA-binding MarR family transcriptional regulator
MRAFVRVVEQESFSAAAAVLGLTPSAVSRLVSKLEDRLGVRQQHHSDPKRAADAQADEIGPLPFASLPCR